MELLPLAFDVAGPSLMAAEEVRDLLSCIVHAGLNGGLRDADDLGHLADRHLMVVDEVDHLAMWRRQSGQAASQNRALLIAMQHVLGVVGALDRLCESRAQLLRGATPQRRQSQVACDGEQPGRYLCAGVVVARTPPDV